MTNIDGVQGGQPVGFDIPTMDSSLVKDTVWHATPTEASSFARQPNNQAQVPHSPHDVAPAAVEANELEVEAPAPTPVAKTDVSAVPDRVVSARVSEPQAQPSQPASIPAFPPDRVVSARVSEPQAQPSQPASIPAFPEGRFGAEPVDKGDRHGDNAASFPSDPNDDINPLLPEARKFVPLGAKNLQVDIDVVAAGPELAADQANDKLRKFFNRTASLNFRKGKAALKAKDIADLQAGDSVSRINSLLGKAKKFGKMSMSRPYSMSKKDWAAQQRQGSARAAETASRHPKRFAELFEMRIYAANAQGVMQKVGKHGTESQRHQAYGVLYAMAAQGRSIEELEDMKAELVNRIDTADGYIAERDLRNDMTGYVADMSKGLDHEMAMEHRFGASHHEDRRFWTSLNYEGHELALAYTARAQKLAQGSAAVNTDHVEAMARFGVTKEDAGFILAQISRRLPHLESDPREHQVARAEQIVKRGGGDFDYVMDQEYFQFHRHDERDIAAASKDQSDKFLQPGDDQYIAAYNEKMSELMRIDADEFRLSSENHGIPHVHAQDEVLHDARYDKIRAIVFAIGTAHPHKVMSDELKPFAHELCSLDDKQLNTILRDMNQSSKPHRDELWNDMKTHVEVVFRDAQEQIRLAPPPAQNDADAANEDLAARIDGVFGGFDDF